MKKTQLESSKALHYRKNNDQIASPAPKKQFQLLYRERDPEHAECAYENIIFMKSKKCETKQTSTKRKSENKIKNQSVQGLAEMVAQIEKQFKTQKQKQNRKAEDSAKQNVLKSPTSAKNLFKNKQIKDTFHSKASSRWMKYKKQEILSTDNVKKYKNMLSPSRSLKPKEGETLSSKFMKSTQETFRKEPKIKDKRKSKVTNPVRTLQSASHQEYVLLQNNFVQLTHEDVNLLELKITSNKTVSAPSKKQFELVSNKICSEFEEEEVEWSNHIINEHTEEESQQPQANQIFYEENLKNIQTYIVGKVKKIQRWWRKLLKSEKEKQLNPIVFQSHKSNEEFDESMLFIHNDLVKDLQVSEVSPIKMVEAFNFDQKEDRLIEDKKDPFDERERAAEQQMETHQQLLDQLLSAKKISSETYFEKKMLIEAKYHNEMQHIEELRKIMIENTQRAYEINKKTQEDKTTLENIDAQIDEKTLDKIFGKDFCNSVQSPNNSQLFNGLPANYEMMVVNRQKSTGCHFDGQDKIKPSIYQKRQNEEQEYEQDFEEQESEEEHQQAHEEENCNSLENNSFSQLLDEYKVRQEVKMQIDKRAAIQMGALVQQIPEQIRSEHIGIDTSLSSIHKFILSFFKFYIFYYKNEFLKLINMPYGYSVEKRLKFLHGYDEEADFPEEDENGVIYGLQTVISEDILDDFYEKIYDLNIPMPTAKRTNFEFEKIHNRAILDCFNESLNFFRPYFFINGPAYPWNNSEKALTFYYIAEDNLQEVFEKTQFKVLKWASTLCGIIVNKYSSPCPPLSDSLSVEQVLELYKTCSHPDLVEMREDRLTKNEKVQIIESYYEWGNLQEQSAIIQLENSDFVFTRLIEEFVLEYYLQVQPEAGNDEAHLMMNKNFDFFQGLSEEQLSEEY